MLDDEKFLKAVGKHIDKLRKKQKISFSELALRSEVEKPNLVNITSKGTNITLITLNKIAKGLGVPVKDLLDF